MNGYIEEKNYIKIPKGLCDSKNSHMWKHVKTYITSSVSNKILGLLN
jgi:hypothetical protein